MPTPNAVQLLIYPPPGYSSNDITAFWVQDQWSVNEELGRQGSTASILLEAPFLIPSLPKETALTQKVKTLSKIELKDTTLGKTLFAGLVATPQFLFTGPTLGRYLLYCRDYTYYADAKLMTYTPPLNTPAGVILRSLTTDANVGITNDPLMSDGPVVDHLQIDHLYLSDAWDQLSQLSSWQNDFNWNVTPGKVVQWGSELNATISGLTVTDDPASFSGVSSQTTAFIDKSKRFVYEWDGSTLRNSCTVRGASNHKTTTDNWVGDGSQKAWPLSYDLYSGDPFTLTVAGASKTVEVSVDPSSSTMQFVVSQAKNGQWFLQVATASTPSSGQVIALSYTYNQPILATYRNSASVSVFAGLDNGGVFEMYVADNTLTTLRMVYARARSEVQQFGLPQERVTFTLTADFPGHVQVGDALSYQTVYVPDARNNWNVGLTDYFIVQRVLITGVPGGWRQYEVTAVRYHNILG